MKKTLLILILINSLLFSNSLSLSKRDIIILKKIKSLSENTMMQYSLMAIAIKESNLGKSQANYQSGDFGLFQSNIKTVLRRYNAKDTLENRVYYATKLINDVGFATANAIVELQYWNRVHKNHWGKTWASYNTGWRYKGKTGLNYAKSIFEIIKKLKFEYSL